MIKYANASILQVITPESLKGFSPKFAEAIAPAIQENVYIVTEGIHGGWNDEAGNPVIIKNSIPNQNGDFFYWKELIGKSVIPGRTVYETWIDKPVLENHNEREIRGAIIDTNPVEKRHSIDMLDMINGKEHPDLAERIRKGEIKDTSMGVIVGYSVCSQCGNVAFDESLWCNHLKYHKGQIDPETGKLIFEINHDLVGLEDSLITQGFGADDESKIREILGKLKEQSFAETAVRNTFKIYASALGVEEKELAKYLRSLFN